MPLCRHLCLKKIVSYFIHYYILTFPAIFEVTAQRINHYYKLTFVSQGKVKRDFWILFYVLFMYCFMCNSWFLFIFTLKKVRLQLKGNLKGSWYCYNPKIGSKYDQKAIIFMIHQCKVNLYNLSFEYFVRDDMYKKGQVRFSLKLMASKTAQLWHER